MMTTTLILGAVFWTAVTATIIDHVKKGREEEMASYCKVECKGFVKGTAAEPAEIAHYMAYGGRHHA